jgi:hypothetical protein
MDNIETDKEKLLRLQIELETSRQVEDILSEFKRDIDARFDKFEQHLQNRPTNEQVEASLQKCLDSEGLVYKKDFQDEWEKANEKHMENTHKKTNDWTTTLKNVGFIILLLFGFFTMFGSLIKDFLTLLK